jgi:hypothetical protein
MIIIVVVVGGAAVRSDAETTDATAGGSVATQRSARHRAKADSWCDPRFA